MSVIMFELFMPARNDLFLITPMKSDCKYMSGLTQAYTVLAIDTLGYWLVSYVQSNICIVVTSIINWQISGHNNNNYYCTCTRILQHCTYRILSILADSSYVPLSLCFVSILAALSDLCTLLPCTDFDV